MASFPNHSGSSTLAIVSCAVILLASSFAFAGPVPGDPNPNQTTGQVFATYGFTVNTTTYSNTTLDTADMSALVSNCADGDFTTALNIWNNGKNSLRSYTPTIVYRVPKLVVERVYTGEDWYTSASAYYRDDTNRYLGRIIEDALTGQGTFQSECRGVRAEVVKAGMLFYPILYFYHETDAAVRTMRTITTNGDDAAIAKLYAANVEVQDGWACYYAPDARYAQINPFTAASSTSSASRVGGSSNPWEVQTSLHRFFTCNGSPQVLSPINRDLLALAKESNNYIYRALTKTPGISSAEVDEIVTDLRRKQQLLLNIHQVQLTMKAVYEACRTPDRKFNHGGYRGGSSNCDGSPSCSRAEQLWAAAWTHWRLAEVTFQDTAYPRPISAERLQGVRSLLDPTAITSSSFDPSRDQCKAVYEAVQGIYADFGFPEGYSWQSVVGRTTCKRFY